MTDNSNGDNTLHHAAGAATAHDRLVDAFLALLADRRFEAVTLAAVADRASLTLAEFRGEFDSKLDLVTAFVKRIDRQVLADCERDDGESTPRERLFDILMRRFERLGPHRAALRHLRTAATGDPALAVALNCLALRSQTWMMAAAGIKASGLRGLAQAQGLVVLFARVAETWLDDDDPGLARTMARLDRDLSRAAAWSNRLDDICRLVPRRGRWSRDRAKARPDGEELAPAAAI